MLIVFCYHQPNSHQLGVYRRLRCFHAARQFQIPALYWLVLISQFSGLHTIPRATRLYTAYTSAHKKLHIALILNSNTTVHYTGLEWLSVTASWVLHSAQRRRKYEYKMKTPSFWGHYPSVYTYQDCIKLAPFPFHSWILHLWPFGAEAEFVSTVQMLCDYKHNVAYIHFGSYFCNFLTVFLLISHGKR